MDTLTALCAIGGWVIALIVNVVWYRQYEKMIAEWRKRCEHIDAKWYDLWMELLDECAEPKDEPQMRCEFCRREGDDLCWDCPRTERSE